MYVHIVYMYLTCDGISNIYIVTLEHNIHDLH